MMKRIFAIQSPPVIHESLEGEVIIINLDNGHYFSVQSTGAIVWQLIAQQHSAEAIIAALEAFYSADSQQVASTVDSFLTSLLQEQLIYAVDTDQEASDNTKIKLDTATLNPEYEAPKLQKFTDMEELLLLDPIHEISEQGWPHSLNKES